MFYHVFPSLIGKEKHYSLAQQICLFPAVLREHLENRRTNKLLNIRRDDVSKPIALLDQTQAQIFSLKELDVSAPCRVISRHANEWWMCKHVMTCLECLGPLCEYMVKECQGYVDSITKSLKNPLLWKLVRDRFFLASDFLYSFKLAKHVRNEIGSWNPLSNSPIWWALVRWLFRLQSRRAMTLACIPHISTYFDIFNQQGRQWKAHWDTPFFQSRLLHLL